MLTLAFHFGLIEFVTAGAWLLCAFIVIEIAKGAPLDRD